jgi:hypothetical protein
MNMNDNWQIFEISPNERCKAFTWYTAIIIQQMPDWKPQPELQLFQILHRQIELGASEYWHTEDETKITFLLTFYKTVFQHKILMKWLIQKPIIFLLSEPPKINIGNALKYCLSVLKAELPDGYGKRAFNCAWNRSPRAPRTSIWSKQRIISVHQNKAFL